jgi:hypothetical protein
MMNNDKQGICGGQVRSRDKCLPVEGRETRFFSYKGKGGLKTRVEEPLRSDLTGSGGEMAYIGGKDSFARAG